MNRFQTLTLALAVAVLVPAGLAQQVPEQPLPTRPKATVLSHALASVAAQSADSVVSIHVTRTLPRSRTETSARGAGLQGMGARESTASPYFRAREIDGSGVIWSADGEVLTTHWNIGEAVDEIIVTTHAGKVFNAKLVGYDKVLDVALLKLDGVTESLPVLKRARAAPRVGEWVVTVGHSRAAGSHTAATGVISAVDRRPREDFLFALQHSCRINYSNVGGPLVNLRGEVVALTVGLNSDPRLNPAGINSGVSFAVPIAELEKIADRLRTGEERERLPALGPPSPGGPFVGVRLQEDVFGRGVLVEGVVEESSAAKGGMQDGDVILEYNGVTVKQIRKLQREIRKSKVGDVVVVEVERDGTRLALELELGARPRD